MLELRTQSRNVLRWLKTGEPLALTFRGKKVATLLPEENAAEQPIPTDDPIRRLHELAEPMGSLTNEEIDRVLYGEQGHLH